MSIPAKTDEEIRQLALDLLHGRIFTDRHCPDAESIRYVFMVFPFLDGDALDQLRDDPPGLVYEYLDKAGPRSINGLPSFFSMNTLSQADTERVFALVARLRASTQTALQET
jgi:hypothetical protein